MASLFTVFPDNSAPGKVRFFDALVTHGAKIRKTLKGNRATLWAIALLAGGCATAANAEPRVPSPAGSASCRTRWRSSHDTRRRFRR